MNDLESLRTEPRTAPPREEMLINGRQTVGLAVALGLGSACSPDANDTHAPEPAVTWTHRAAGLTATLLDGGVEVRPDAASRSLHLHTIAVARGEESMRSSTITDRRTESDGALELTHADGVVERFEPRREGVEHAYRFAREPRGHGDLVVRVAAEGLPLVAAAGGEHRFGQPGEQGRVVYGAATWIDADGDRADVRVTVVGGEIELRVPEDVIEGSSFPAVLDPLVSAEIELDAQITTSSPSGAQKPGIPASNGSVWAFPLTGDVSGVSSAQLFRVDASGQLLDASPIVLQTGLSYSGASAAASDGTNFLVLWNPVSQAQQSRAARVTAAGAVLDPGGFSAPYFAAGSSAIFAGGNYWYSTGPRSVRRITPAGALLDATDQQFASQTAGTFGSSAQLAVIGTTIAAVWSEVSGFNEFFYAARFGTNLVPVDATPIVLGTKTVSTRAIAANGSSFLISFDDCVVHLGTTGAASAPLCTTPSIETLVPDGANFIARSGQQLWRLDANGNRLTMPANTFGDAVSRTSIAMSRSAGDLAFHYLIGATGKTATFSRFNPSTLAPVPPIDRVGVPNATLVGNVERRPEVASGQADWMVAWEDYRSPQGIYGVHVDANGQPSAPTATLLYGIAPKDEPLPFAAGATSDYMLIAGNKAVRVLSNGTVAAPISLPDLPFPAGATAGVAPRIARGSGGYLVTVSVAGVSSDSKLDWNYWLDDAGNTVSGPTITGQTGTWGEYAIASDGTSYMQILRVEGSPGELGKLYRKIFDALGNVVVPSAEFMPAADYQTLWVASGGGVYLLVYRLGAEVHAQRLDATTGALLDVAPIVVATGSEPRVAFDGTDFWVTWQATSATDYDVWARRVSVAGALVDAAPVVISNHTTPAAPAHGHELAPTLGFRAGSGLVAYMYDDPADGYHGFRARARALEPMGCVMDADCAAGLVCVNATCELPSMSSSASTSTGSTSSSTTGASTSVASGSSTGSTSSSTDTSSGSTTASAGTGGATAGGGGGTAAEGGGGCSITGGRDDVKPLWIGVAFALVAAGRRRRRRMSRPCDVPGATRSLGAGNR